MVGFYNAYLPSGERKYKCHDTAIRPSIRQQSSVLVRVDCVIVIGLRCKSSAHEWHSATDRSVIYHTVKKLFGNPPTTGDVEASTPTIKIAPVPLGFPNKKEA